MVLSSVSNSLTQGQSKKQASNCLQRYPSGDIQVKLYADLSEKAFLNDKVDELIFWHCLRAINQNGCGYLLGRNLDEILAPLETFGYSRSAAYRQLAKGEGKFWQTIQSPRHTVVKIYSLKTVAMILSTTLDGDKHARLIPAAAFSTIAQRRAQLYASLSKPEGIRANPVTRENLTTRTGVNKRRQRRYEKKAGVKRTNNYESQSDGNITSPVWAEYHSLNKSTGVVKTYRKHRRLPNIYHSQQQPGCRGQATQVHKVLKKREQGLLGKRSESSSPHGGAAQLIKVMKVFFPSCKALLRGFRSTQGHDRQGFCLIRNPFRVIPNRLEWLCVAN